MQRTIFDSLDALTTKRAACIFEPIGDQSTELDAAAELAAFVARPDRSEGFETKEQPRTSKTFPSTGLSAFAEAAGLYGTR